MDYGKIISRSVELIKKNKWLWVYGLTIAILSGGSGGNSSNYSRSFNSSSNKTFELPRELPRDLPEKSSKVLGETLSALEHWFTSVPVGNWVLIGLGFFMVLGLWVIVSMIAKAWATGGLIAALDDADGDKPVTLASTSPRGIASVGNLIILGLISAGLGICFFVILLIFVFGGFALLSLVPPLNMIWMFVSIMIAVVTTVIFVIFFAMISVYAERLIVLKGYAPWDAWKKGLALSRGNFIPTAVMGILNTAIGCLGGCMLTIAMVVIFAIPALALGFASFAGGEFKFPGIPVIGGFGLLLYAFIQLSTLTKAMFIMFNFANWNLLFKEVWSKEKES